MLSRCRPQVPCIIVSDKFTVRLHWIQNLLQGITASLIIARVALGISSNGSHPLEQRFTAIQTSGLSLSRRMHFRGELSRSSTTETDEESSHIPIQDIPIFLPQSPSSSFDSRNPHRVSGRTYSASWFTLNA